MKNFSIFLISFLIFVSSLQAQQVAITGINTSTPDGFAFVALSNLTAGQVIYFCDGPYVASTNSFNVTSSNNDAVMSYTVPAGGLPEGTVIRVVESNNNNQFTLTRSSGSPTGVFTVVTNGNNFSLSAGEGIWAFSASNPSSPQTTMTDLYGGVLTANGTGAGDDPSQDANAPLSPDFYLIVSASDNTQFSTVAATRTNTTLAMFIDNAAPTPNYWTVSNNNITLSTTAFVTPGFGGGTFPVELIDFRAEAGANAVNLTWVTASELNNDYFAVERSLDATLFEEIGREAGAGTTQELQSYNFTDSRPLATRMYYRLRQVDYDGAFSYSQVVEVEGSQVESKVVFYPNPVTDVLHVDYATGTLKIYTLTGQLVSTHSLKSNTNVVDVASLQSGYYFVVVEDEHHNLVSSSKLVK